MIGTGDQRIIDALYPMISARRAARIENVIAERTYGVSVVLESLYDQANAAAIMRTCDGFGIQRVNLVITGPNYKCDRKVSIGAHKWLDVHRYGDATSCARDLKAEGYTLLTTHLDESRSIEEIDFSGKVALVFGTERDGVSDEMLALSDGNFKIPMAGFAQSFNVSVAAAVALYHAISDRRRRTGSKGDLSDLEQRTLRERFYRRTVRASDLLVEELRK